jgi:hypothetical protein
LKPNIDCARSGSASIAYRKAKRTIPIIKILINNDTSYQTEKIYSVKRSPLPIVRLLTLILLDFRPLVAKSRRAVENQFTLPALSGVEGFTIRINAEIAKSFKLPSAQSLCVF